MSNEEMDRAIAEHLGWELVPLDGREFNGIPVMVWKRPDGERGFPIPRYSTDLNAMHETEKTLTDKQKSMYVIELVRVCPSVPETYSFQHRFMCATYTATQRAQAFLRTIGKWRNA